VYVLVAAPLFWAWYVVLPIALLALADAVPLTIILTVTSRIVAPLDLIRLRDGLSWTTQVWLTTAIALWIPLAYIVWRMSINVALSGRCQPNNYRCQV